MTNIPIRVKRETGFEAIDIDQLTDQELADFLKTLDEERLRSFLTLILKWIRNNVTDQPPGAGLS